MFVRNVIRHGYALVFTDGGPPPLSRVPLAIDPSVDGKARLNLEEAVASLLQKGAILSHLAFTADSS